MSWLRRLLPKKNNFFAEPMRRDWSALAREPGKHNEFIEALATRQIHFLIVPSGLPSSFPDNGDELMQQIEDHASELNELTRFETFTYESTSEEKTLPILSSSSMLTEFINNSPFAKQGYFAWHMIGKSPPETIFILMQYAKSGIKLLLNSYTKYSYQLSADDLIGAFQYRERNGLPLGMEETDEPGG
jgi:hypothetical protein